MAISEIYSGTKSGLVTGDTEWSLTANSTTVQTDTTDCVVQPWIDVSDMVAGDQLRIRVYEKCRSGDSQRLVDETILTGTQSKPLWTMPTLIMLHGWDITAEVLADGGANGITLYWSLRGIT